MRDYTYLEGYRFTIWNIYRSKRFDVDRLDINFADKDMPEFVRGLRIVDHLENESYTVHGDDADHLSYSMCFIHNSNKEDRPDQFDDMDCQICGRPICVDCDNSCEDNAVFFVSRRGRGHGSG